MRKRPKSKQRQTGQSLQPHVRQARATAKMNPAEKLLHKAEFICSVPKAALGPADTGGEVAFAGRSNAGKSSALNTMTRQNALARTSKTPGRTQHIVYFSLTPEWRLVDLPGYGYAKVTTKVKQEWGQAIEEYLNTRQSLRGMVLLMDIRHPLTEHDVQFIEWCDATDMPLLVLLTKSDKLKFGAAKASLLQVQQALIELPDVKVMLFSALKGDGVAQACEVVATWLAG